MGLFRKSNPEPEPSKQVCPTCKGAGEVYSEEGALFDIEPGFDNPQVRTVSIDRICGTCGGSRWINGGSR